MKMGFFSRRSLGLRHLRAAVFSINTSIPVDCTHLVSSDNYVASTA